MPLWQELFSRNEAHMRAALANTPVVLFAQDRALRYTWLFNAHHGLTDAEAHGKTDADLFPPDEAATLTALKHAVLDTGVGQQAEVAAVRGSRTYAYEVHVEPLRDERGAVVGVAGTATDITARKERDALRDAERAHAEQQRRVRERFLGLVAHDLAQPLTVIRSTISLLRRRSGVDADLARRLATIEQATERMQRLVADLGDAASIEAGQFRMQPLPMDLVAAVAQIVAEQRLGAPDRQLLLESPDRLTGHWDAQRLGQLLTNLIGNALKYSAADRPVLVVVEDRGSEAVVRVVDQGSGIAPADQAAIFAAFARLPAGNAGGSGLGLYISKGIAEAHGGRLWVESQPGRGSVFVVALPRTRPDGTSGTSETGEADEHGSR